MAYKGEEWTVRELRLIERHYGRMQRKELMERYLPERTIKGIEHRAGLLGLRRRVKPAGYWTDVEVERLKRFYGTMPRKEAIARYLPDRSPKQLDEKAGRLGLRRRRHPTRSWSTEDLALLREYYGTLLNIDLRAQYFPRVSVRTICHRARRLGLRSKEPNWTKSEDRLIERHYGRLSNPMLSARYLPHRTSQALQGRATKLGLTRGIEEVWSARELRLLKRYYPTHTAREMLGYLPGRTQVAIRVRARLQYLQKERHRAWKAPELALIRRRYEAKNGLQRLVRELAGRTKLAIQQQARKLGLSRAGNPWTASDDARLRQLYPHHGLKTRIPGHTPGSVRVHAQKLGLRVGRPRLSFPVF